VLHPVGRLPARVYWRRRLVVLTVLLGVLAGGGWLTLRLVDGGLGPVAAAPTTSSSAVPTPALERVLPSLAAVRTPEAGPGMPGAEMRRTPVPQPAGPTPGGPCTDDMIDLAMRAPTVVPAGSTPRLEIVVRNVSDVPCVRRLDKELQEILLLDPDGERVWGSNDCFPEESDRSRTLAPGEGVALTIVWGGLTSEPECAGERTTPPAGLYLLRGRLDAKTTPDRRIRLS
jgi:hypothetical protein